MKGKTDVLKQQDKRKIFIRKFHNNWEFFIMVLPGALAMLVFCYLPMVGILVAFKDINYIDGILKSPWCGFKNFEFFLKSPKLHKF